MLRRLGLIDRNNRTIIPTPPFSVYSRGSRKRRDLVPRRTGVASTTDAPATQPLHEDKAPETKQSRIAYEAEFVASEDQTPSGTEIAEALNMLFAGVVERISKAPRDEYILKYRLGLGEEGEFPTLSELGSLFNISRERVRQLEKRGMRQVHAQLRRNPSYKAGILLNLFQFGLPLRQQPALDLFINFLREQIASQAVRIRWGTLVYCALAEGAAGYKKSELLFLSDYRAHLEKLNVEWAETKRLWKEGRNAHRFQQWWDTLVHEVFWPEDKGHIHFDSTRLVPLREPNDLSLGDTTSFWSPKNNRMVMAESDLERVTYDILEAAAEVITYTEQPVRIDYTYQGKKRVYYPDIVVRLTLERDFLFEVKDRLGMVLCLTLVKALAAKKWAHERGLGFGIFSPRGHSYTKFSKMVLDPAWVTVILDAIDKKGVLNWNDMRTLQHEWPYIPADHLLALIVQHDLAFSLRPYRLSRLPLGLSFKPLIKSD